MLAVVGVLVLAPLVASVPAQAAEVPANAIVVRGSDTANAWVDDDSNSTVTASGSLSLIVVTATLPGGETSGIFFSTNGTGDPLPTSGQHAVSATGPLRIELSDRHLVGCDVEGSVDITS